MSIGKLFNDDGLFVDERADPESRDDPLVDRETKARELNEIGTTERIVEVVIWLSNRLSAGSRTSLPVL